MPTKIRLPSLLALGASLSTTIFAFGSSPCYYANGTQVSITYIRQCSDGVQTTCCSLGRENVPGNETNEAGWTQDECLPNGLCQNRNMINGVKHTTFWLEYCTDPDVTSTNCLDVCRQTRDKRGGSQMTPCGVSGDGTYNALDDDRETTRWCCGTSDACCTNNIDVIELPRNFTGRVVQSSVSSASPSPTSSGSETSQTASQSQTPTPSSTMNTTAKAGNNGLSTGAKAGIGVGAAVGAIAIMLAAFFGHKAYGYRKLAKEREVEDQHALQSSIYEHEQKYAQPGYVAELTAPSTPAELPHARAPGELEGSPQSHYRD